MLRLFKIILLITLTLNVALPAKSYSMQIVAVAGNTAISSLDLEERLKLNMSLSNIPRTKENIARLKPQALRMLVDEAIYKEEAGKYNLKVLDSELRSAIANLERQNSLPAGGFETYLQQNAISKDSIEDQLKSQIIWSKLVGRQVRSKIVVTDKDIEEKMENMYDSPGVAEINISEIVLPIDNIDTKEKVSVTANDLYELLSSGADFNLVASEFSQSPTSSNGGLIGWIQEDQTSKSFSSVVSKLRKGNFSKPFFSNGNFYIIKLNDKRVLVKNPLLLADVKIKHAFIPSEKSSDRKETLVNKINNAKDGYKSCDDFESFSNLIGSKSKVGLIDTNLEKLSPNIRTEVVKTPENELTNIIKGKNGLHIFGICEKKDSEAIKNAKKQLKNVVSRRKLELQAQRYLQKLRRDAYIEIRS